MPKIHALFVSLISILAAASAFASNNRSAVSINGIDANPCTVASPCRSFGVAISQTTAGGDVIALDSAGYGAFTVDRSVTVAAAPGVYAGITATTGSAITLGAGSLIVVLKDLNIIGLGAVNGIADGATHELYIEHCSITGFATGAGVVFYAASGAFENILSISHSTIRGNTVGVHMSPGSLTMNMMIADTLIASNYYGVSIDSAGISNTILVRSRLIANNTAVSQNKVTSSAAYTEIENCQILGGADAVISDGSSGGISSVRLSNCTIAGNGGTAIFSQNGGSVYSRLNNTIEDGNGVGTITGPYTAK